MVANGATKGYYPAHAVRLFAPRPAGLFIAFDLGAWHLSLHMTSVANATLLANMAPIFVTLGAWLLFKSRVSTSFMIGLAVAVIGVVVLKGGPGELLQSQSSGDAMALLAAVFYAGYILSVGRLRSRFSTMRIMLWSSAIAAVFSLPVSYFMEGQILPATLYGWLILAGLAWVTHAAGQSMIAYALAYLPASFSSLTLLLQPVVAAFSCPDHPVRTHWHIAGSRRHHRDIGHFDRSKRIRYEKAPVSRGFLTELITQPAIP